MQFPVLLHYNFAFQNYKQFYNSHRPMYAVNTHL